MNEDPHQSTNQIQKVIDRHLEKSSLANFGPAVTLGASLQTTTVGSETGKSGQFIAARPERPHRIAGRQPACLVAFPGQHMNALRINGVVNRTKGIIVAHAIIHDLSQWLMKFPLYINGALAIAAAIATG